jgi:uncharacterized membrane protein YhhN
MMGILALAVLLDPLGSGGLGDYMLVSLESLGLAVLSIGANSLFVFAGRRPRRAYYVVAIASFVLSQWIFLRHGLEWWRGAMFEAPLIGPAFGVVPVLSAVALLLVGAAPSLRRQRDERFSENGSVLPSRPGRHSSQGPA